MSNHIAISDALSLILPHVTVVQDRERVPLREALGRILAEPVEATVDWPPFRRSAMDGYAFRASESPGTLRVVGTVLAGQVWHKPLGIGEALRIMTGAPVPPELDTVLEQEAIQDGQTIAVLQKVKPDRNIMPQGHEYQAGTRLKEPGEKLTAIALGQLAGLGWTHVNVLSKPRVLVLVTGNEVLKAGQPLSPGHIYDTTGPLLQTLATELGAHASLRYVKDNKRLLLQALEQAGQNYDLVMTTGGVSVGIRDYLPDLLQEHFQRLFWRVDMHPGKAMAAGLIREGVPVLSLSGNPGATLTAWYLIAACVVAALTGQTFSLKPVTGRLMHAYSKPTRETRYLKAKFIASAEGLRYDLSPNQSSDALRSFAEADGLVIIPHHSPPQPLGQPLSGLLLPGRTMTTDPATRLE